MGRPKNRLYLALGMCAVTLGVAGAAAGGIGVQDALRTSGSAAATSLEAAADAHRALATDAQDRVDVARAAADAADGRVLELAPVEAVRRAADHLEETGDALLDRADAATDVAARATDVQDWHWGALRDATYKAESFTLDSARSSTQEAGTSLASSLVALNDATAAWEAEQARLAAEKAEQERLAAEAAERARLVAEQEEKRRVEQAARATAVPAAPQRGATAPPAGSASGSAPAPSAQSAAPRAQAQTSKRAIADATFARFGFTNVVYDGGQSQGHYGATDLNNQVIYMQLSLIPTDRVASVAIHEYMHILQAREFGGYDATVAHFGSVRGMELDADRRARANGATWTHYR